MKTTEQKLHAIGKLQIREITFSESVDIANWLIIARLHDTDSLTEKQRERIDAIFSRFFED